MEDYFYTVLNLGKENLLENTEIAVYVYLQKCLIL